MSEPYIPFYSADYLADTMHLSLEEHGAYLKLLMCMWRAGGWLPDEDKKICAILGCTPKKWTAIKAAIAPFFIREEGKFSQKRLLAERKKAEEKIYKASAAGKKSADAKYQKKNNTASTDVDVGLELKPDSVATSRAVLRTPEPEPNTSTTTSAGASEIGLKLEEILQSPMPLAFAPVIAWLEWGADYELDIKPAAERWKRKNPNRPLHTLQWLGDDVARNLEQRKQGKPAFVNGSTAPPGESESEMMQRILDEV